MKRVKTVMAMLLPALAAACLPTEEPRYAEAPQPAEVRPVLHPQLAANAEESKVYEYH